MSATVVRLPVDPLVDEHELLRRWHEERDEEARRLVRLFAELSITEELGVPRRG